MGLKKNLKLVLLGFLLLNLFVFSMAKKTIPSIDFVLNETSYTRLCSTKNILTVNGLFPGPALHVRKGDRLIVNVQNQGNYNVTLHCEATKKSLVRGRVCMQCPIKPGANFSYELIFSTEEGTLWWHAHSDWSRATVHGPIIIYPKVRTNYPFPKPDAEFPIVLASWFKGDVMEIIQTALANGGEPNISDALPSMANRRSLQLIMFDFGKTYLLRIINSIMNEEMFFMVADHNLTVVGMDGAYLKPIKSDYIMITPGQTMDVLIARIQWKLYISIDTCVSNLPNYTDINVTNFTRRLRALASTQHPVDVPKVVDIRLVITLSMNTLPCANNSCDGPNGDRLATSMNNISFVDPKVDILQAYYKQIRGIYKTNFPSVPPYVFNFTADDVRVLKYNSSVEIVFQGTNVLNGAENHPIHQHGYSFYVVGFGFGNFDNETDPEGFNLVDPPEMNTVGVPTNGWAAIRFKADNPGVWFMHCHLDRHMSWGMDTVLIVKNGTTRLTSMRRAPSHLNPC
ncbi:Laccase-14 [Camellia lanceoleosa]|nr:Laccase-14 [Camellia lanceoleosa]